MEQYIHTLSGTFRQINLVPQVVPSNWFWCKINYSSVDVCPGLSWGLLDLVSSQNIPSCIFTANMRWFLEWHTPVTKGLMPRYLKGKNWGNMECFFFCFLKQPSSAEIYLLQMNKYAIICICSINWKIRIHIRTRNGPGLTGSVQDWPEAVNSSLKLIWANQHATSIIYEKTIKRTAPEPSIR